MGEILRRFERNKAQVAAEFEPFVKLLLSEGVTSYLEIGSQYGGALWAAGSSLPTGSRIVSVDMPTGDTAASLEECVGELCKLGHNVHLYFGDSTRLDIVDRVRDLGPFGCVFIDGDHTLEGVKKDWWNYPGKMVAFHDIAWDKPVKKWPKPIEVCKVWRELKQTHRHVEFIAPGSYKGIGVLWTT